MRITDKGMDETEGKAPVRIEVEQRTERVYDFDNYVKRLITSKRVQTFLQPHLDLYKEVDAVIEGGRSVFHPMHIYVSTSCGFNIAGQLWYYPNEPSMLEISSWILVDANETRRVIRHELAHDIKTYCNLAGKVHGKGFNQALRVVSNRRWKKDKHWHTNQQIEEARKKIIST